MKADHLLGGQRWMFHRPAVQIDEQDVLRLQRQIGGQNQRLGVVRIRENVEREGRLNVLFIYLDRW